MRIYDTMQYILFSYICIQYNYHNSNIIVIIMLQKTEQFNYECYMASVDAFVPVCLSLAMFLTRPFLGHSAG